jgi:hypothetical protein
VDTLIASLFCSSGTAPTMRAQHRSAARAGSTTRIVETFAPKLACGPAQHQALVERLSARPNVGLSALAQTFSQISCSAAHSLGYSGSMSVRRFRPARGRDFSQARRSIHRTILRPPKTVEGSDLASITSNMVERPMPVTWHTSLILKQRSAQGSGSGSRVAEGVMIDDLNSSAKMIVRFRHFRAIRDSSAIRA